MTFISKPDMHTPMNYLVPKPLWLVSASAST